MNHSIEFDVMQAFRELRAKAQLKRTFGKVGRNESSLHNIRRLLVLK